MLFVHDYFIYCLILFNYLVCRISPLNRTFENTLIFLILRSGFSILGQLVDCRLARVKR